MKIHFDKIVTSITGRIILLTLCLFVTFFVFKSAKLLAAGCPPNCGLVMDGEAFCDCPTPTTEPPETPPAEPTPAEPIEPVTPSPTEPTPGTPETPVENPIPPDDKGSESPSDLVVPLGGDLKADWSNSSGDVTINTNDADAAVQALIQSGKFGNTLPPVAYLTDGTKILITTGIDGKPIVQVQYSDKSGKAGPYMNYDPSTGKLLDNSGTWVDSNQTAALTVNGTLIDQINANGGSQNYTILSINPDGTAVVGVQEQANGARVLLTINLGSATSKFVTGDTVKLTLASELGVTYNQGALVTYSSATANAVEQGLLTGNLFVTKVNERVFLGYSCNTNTNQCSRVEDGEYSSSSACNSSCSPAISTYSCNSATGECYKDVNGKSDQSVCQANCKKANQAILLVANKTTVLKNEPVVFVALGQNLDPNILNWTIDDNSLTTQICNYASKWGMSDFIKICSKVGVLSNEALSEKNQLVANNSSLIPTGSTSDESSNTSTNAPESSLSNILEALNPLNWFKGSTVSPLSQCTDGGSCVLCGNSCVKIPKDGQNSLKCADVTLPNASCECLNNSCRLKYGESASLGSKIKNYISLLATHKALADNNLNSAVEYSWSRIGTYRVYVEGYDLNGNLVRSNTVSIDVVDTPKYACNSLTGACELNSSGAYLDMNTCQADCKTASPIIVPPTCTINNSAISPSETLYLGGQITFSWATTGCTTCDIECNQSSNCGFNSPLKNVGLNDSDNLVPVKVKPKTSGYYAYKLVCQGEGPNNRAEANFSKGIYDNCSEQQPQNCLRVRRLFIFETPAFLKALFK